MHEKLIAEEIINKAKEHGKVKSITVEVGDLAHLPAEDMEKVLKNMTEWDIKIINGPALVKCLCGFEGEPTILEHKHDFVLYECPKCKKVPKAISGEDIILKDVDVE